MPYSAEETSNGRPVIPHILEKGMNYPGDEVPVMLTSSVQGVSERASLSWSKAIQTKKRKTSYDLEKASKAKRSWNPLDDSFSAPKSFPIFRLPRELRDEIYDYAFDNLRMLSTEDSAIVTASYRYMRTQPDYELYHFPKWLQASEQLESEALEQFYSVAQFTLEFATNDNRNVHQRIRSTTDSSGRQCTKPSSACVQHLTVSNAVADLAVVTGEAGDSICFEALPRHYYAMEQVIGKCTAMRNLTLQIELFRPPTWRRSLSDKDAIDPALPSLHFLQILPRSILSRLHIDIRLSFDPQTWSARIKSELLKDFLSMAGSSMKGSVDDSFQWRSWTENDREHGTMNKICLEMNVTRYQVAQVVI
jgi:hypothetical protein